MTTRADEPYFDYLARVKATVKAADRLSNPVDTQTRRQLIKYAQGLLFLLDAPGEDPA